MTINQLNYFIAVVTEGSFSLASDKLGITQPALSMQIQSMEQELEFRVIDRSRKPLKLTPEGEVLFERAREIVLRMEQLKDIGLELSMSDKGLLRVGIIPTVAPYLIPLFIGDMNKEFPEIKIEFTELLTEEIIARIKSGDLDAGIIATPIKAKSVIFQPLFYEKFFLYVSDKHELFEQDEIKLDTFNPNELWYLQEGNCFQNQIADFCDLANQRLHKHSFSFKSDSIESLRRIVEVRGGMTFIPELATINVPSEFESFIKPISPPVPTREISLAVSRIHSHERLTKRLTESIIKSLPSRMLVKPKEGIVDTRIKIKDK